MSMKRHHQLNDGLHLIDIRPGGAGVAKPLVLGAAVKVLEEALFTRVDVTAMPFDLCAKGLVNPFSFQLSFLFFFPFKNRPKRDG